MGDIFENHYPLRLHKLLLCHVPIVFKMLWNMLKGFMSHNTIEKVVFVKCEKEMAEYVDLEQVENSVFGKNLELKEFHWEYICVENLTKRLERIVEEKKNK